MCAVYAITWIARYGVVVDRPLDLAGFIVVALKKSAASVGWAEGRFRASAQAIRPVSWPVRPRVR
jgi:hypothetical protein